MKPHDTALALAAICFASLLHAGAVDPNAVDHFSSGLLRYYLDNDPRSALLSFILAETYDPKEPEIKKAIAEMYLDIGSYEQALEKAMEAAALAPKDDEAKRIALTAAALAGDCSFAENTLKKLSKPRPGDFEIVASCFTRKNEHKKALRIAKVCRKRAPASYEKLAALGRILLGAGEYVAAEEVLRRALALKPDAPDAYIPLANSLIKQGRLKEALKILQSYLAIFPNDRDVYSQYLERLFVVGGTDEIERAIAHYTTLFPDEAVEVWRTYASTAYIQEDYGTAVGAFITTFALSESSDVAALYFAGKCYDELDCPDSAAAMFRLGLSVEPSPDLWTELALLWARQAATESLLATLTQASQEFPDSAGLWFWGGVALRRAKLWDQATHWFAQALHLNPEDEQTLFSLADTRERAGYRSESIALLEKIVAADSSNPMILNYLGYILVDDSVRIAYGKRLIEKALRAEPDNPAYIDSYGWALFREGKTRKALKYLLRAAELYPDDPEIQLHVGDAYYRLGELEKALAHWRRSLELDPDNKALRHKLEKLAPQGGAK